MDCVLSSANVVVQLPVICGYFSRLPTFVTIPILPALLYLNNILGFTKEPACGNSLCLAADWAQAQSFPTTDAWMHVWWLEMAFPPSSDRRALSNLICCFSAGHNPFDIEPNPVQRDPNAVGHT